MKKVLFYALLLVLYALIGVVIFFKTTLIGSKAGMILLLLAMLVLWYATIYFLEKDNRLIKKSKKVATLFNYFDKEVIKELIKTKKEKQDRFELIKSNDTNQKVTVLSIKILNNDSLKSIESNKRLKTFGKLLEIIEEKIEEKYGLIYNIKNDTITCVFNTVYEIDNPDFEAMQVALGINIEIMQERKRNKDFEILRLDMSIVNEKMDFFLRDKRVLLNGDFKLAEELLSIEGEDSIYITDEIYKKYANKLDSEYVGKLYFNNDVKVYKVLKIIECEEEIIERTYVTSKLNIKEGKEKDIKQLIDR